jgi:hypothetical protein
MMVMYRKKLPTNQFLWLRLDESSLSLYSQKPQAKKQNWHNNPE